jgi:hypothetical protein
VSADGSFARAKPFSGSQRNAGFGAQPGRSRSSPCVRANRPIEASKDAVCDIRNPSIPAFRFAQTLKLIGF